MTAHRLPNVLVIGAQKSGTSWLHRFFKESNGVFVTSGIKELNFFDNQQRFEALGVDGYANYFLDWQEETHAAEITPGYMIASGEYPEWGAPDSFRQGIPNRVRHILGPDTKIIALLRNPIDRALSAFLHHVSKGRLARHATVGPALTQHFILHAGFYATHLAAWRREFSPENFFIRTYEDFFSSRTHAFDLLKLLNASIGRDDIFKKRIYRGVGFTRDTAGAHATTGERVATTQEIDLMRALYAQDVLRLSEEWGVNTSSWTDFLLAPKLYNVRA